MVICVEQGKVALAQTCPERGIQYIAISASSRVPGERETRDPLARTTKQGTVGHYGQAQDPLAGLHHPTRQTTLPEPIDEAGVIAHVALRLFGQIWPEGQAVWLIGVGVSGLGSPSRQLSLWDAPPVLSPEQTARQQRMEAALAAIHERFGPNAVRRGNKLEE